VQTKGFGVTYFCKHFKVRRQKGLSEIKDFARPILKLKIEILKVKRNLSERKFKEENYLITILRKKLVQSENKKKSRKEIQNVFFSCINIASEGKTSSQIKVTNEDFFFSLF
jgi:hypothetical protein